MKSKVLVVIFLSVICQQSFAYLDPGTGSMLLSAFIAILATLFFVIKNFYYKAVVFFAGLFGAKIERKHYSLVIYSEGEVYWTTFKPILKELERQKIETVFFTSSEQDLVFQEDYEYVKAQYIGTGNKAYATLNFLEADVLLSTTPGLDVLQIKRSKGVKKYVQVVHSLVGIGKYQFYSFDYFDYVFCSGHYQIEQLRELEKVRGTEPKVLLESGCAYTDLLIERLQKEPTIKNETPVILIAPTWGNNSLFNNISAQEMKKIAELDYQIIIRPHPHMSITQPEILESFQTALKGCDNVTWDYSLDNFESLHRCDLLISDLSGVIYDAVFVFEKPIIAIAGTINSNGIEQYDLADPIWDLEFIKEVGLLINTGELSELSQHIDQVLVGKEDVKNKIAMMKQDNFYNEGCAAETIVGQVVEILEGVQNA